MRPGILLYFDFAAVFRVLAPDDCKSLILALLDYARTGEVPELTGQALQAWPDFKAAADRDAESYEDKTRGKHYGGHVTSSRAAGVEPLTFEEWKQAGEPSTASASCSRASASQSSIHPFNQSIKQSTREWKGSELCDSSELTPEQNWEEKRREALRSLDEI